jgi:peroxiredoxin Q/BCP
MPVPKEGSKAPDLKLSASNGKTVSLSDFKGKERVILYFYPKDDTPGCTVEACGFRDSIKKIEKSGAVVLGISPDGVDSHNKFIEKFKLPFILLSDPDKKACDAYGVWVEKSMYGKTYMGVARTTFVIGKDGRIEKVYEKVKPEGHPEEILEFLNAKDHVQK